MRSKGWSTSCSSSYVCQKQKSFRTKTTITRKKEKRILVKNIHHKKTNEGNSKKTQHKRLRGQIIITKKWN